MTVNTNNIPKLTPKVPAEMREFISRTEEILKITDLAYCGPVHVIFPQLMAKNIHDMQECLEPMGFDYQIFCSHKPTRSKAFVRQARYEGVGIDVASEAELISALSCGFTGERIGCTGVKNDNYLALALLQNCQISVDSLAELERLSAMRNIIDHKPNSELLLRLCEAENADRRMLSRLSRFGMSKDHIKAGLEIIESNPKLSLKGFHFHTDEQIGDVRAGHLEHLISLMEDTCRMGFEPTVIDIGGSLRRPRFVDQQQCSHFIEHLEETLVSGGETHTWRGFPYGMTINDKGRVVGRAQLMVHFTTDDFQNVLEKMFGDTSLRGRRLSDIIAENGFSIALEPGKASMHLSGLTLMRVIETKQDAKGNNLFVLEGNLYNLSINFIDYLPDPELISNSTSPNAEECAGYIVGNLCGEHDIIMKRKVVFPKKPEHGDLICFFDTAAYSADFQDASPHQHPTGKKVVAGKVEGKWKVTSDEAWLPFFADK